MNLKNYTSTVSAERSIAAIERLLVDAGATHIARFYHDKRLAGFFFQMEINDRPLTFKLPAKPDAVRKIMENEVRRPRLGTSNRIREQAERTAWKILHEWVHMQLTMIQMDQAEAIQVFLPYAYDERKSETLFERLKSGGFRLLTSGGESNAP